MFMYDLNTPRFKVDIGKFAFSECSLCTILNMMIVIDHPDHCVSPRVVYPNSSSVEDFSHCFSLECSFFTCSFFILCTSQYPIKNYRCCTGGPLSIMGNNYPCMFPICCA